MSDTDILIANYQSIIRVLASQVRTLELQIHGDGSGCALLPEECNALHDCLTDSVDCYVFRKDYGEEALTALLSAWGKILKGREENA